MKLIGIIHKPVDVEEWPFWLDRMEYLDGECIDVVFGKICTYQKGDVVFVDKGTAVNIKWIHNMEFVYD